MRILLAGAGPTGLFTALTLARRGHEITVLDRDPGPQPAAWPRRGVMQFHHAHTFRGPVVEMLAAHLPDVLDSLTGAGATIVDSPDGRPAALLCRRATFERALRRAAVGQPGITLGTAHADGLLMDRGRVVGLRVGSGTVTADVVLDASGRAGRFAAAMHRPVEGGDCGSAYISRQYRLRDGSDPGPVNSPIGLGLSFPGYVAIVFLHDARTFSVTFIHDGSEPRLRELRHAGVFERAVDAIPALRPWIRRSEPLTGVLPGGRVYNTYRRQTDARGALLSPGLIAVGDAVCTTTPLAGRGITLAFRQVCALVRALDHMPNDIDCVAAQFDGWCAENIRPWFDDHCHADADRVRRWGGGDIDLGRAIPSDLVVAAADADPGLRPVVEPYARMDALPESLAPAQARAREVFASGWRPPVPDGPNRGELAALCASV